MSENIVNERVQSQACLSYAEREQCLCIARTCFQADGIVSAEEVNKVNEHSIFSRECQLTRIFGSFRVFRCFRNQILERSMKLASRFMSAEG